MNSSLRYFSTGFTLTYTHFFHQIDKLIYKIIDELAGIAQQTLF